MFPTLRLQASRATKIKHRAANVGPTGYPNSLAHGPSGLTSGCRDQRLSLDRTSFPRKAGCHECSSQLGVGAGRAAFDGSRGGLQCVGLGEPWRGWRDDWKRRQRRGYGWRQRWGRGLRRSDQHWGRRSAGAAGSAGACNQNVDIVFAMDVSTSMGPFLSKLASSIQVVDQAVKGLGLPSQPHYGLVVFVDDALFVNSAAPYPGRGNPEVGLPKLEQLHRVESKPGQGRRHQQHLAGEQPGCFAHGSKPVRLAAGCRYLAHRDSHDR